MSYDQNVYNHILRLSKMYNIDPAAAVAVAGVEGGVGYGAVGDSGTSFGPFQLHVGGALPQGKDASWANSPAGLEYAIRKMAENGAGGLTGQAAVNAIVRNFENPKNPDAEVARAYQGYGHIQGAQYGTRLPIDPNTGEHFMHPTPQSAPQSVVMNPQVGPSARQAFTSSLIDSIGKKNTDFSALLALARKAAVAG